MLPLWVPPAKATPTLFRCSARSKLTLSPCPSWELCHTARGAEVNTWHWPGHTCGQYGKMPRVSICFFHLVSGASKYMCSSESISFPEPCCQLHGFSSQPRKLVFPVLDSRTVVDMWFKLLTPQRGLLSPCNLSPLQCPLLRVQFPTWLLLFPSYLTLRGSFFTPLVV